MNTLRKIEKLQFITDRPELVKQACEGGCRWIQFRMKEASYEEFIGRARETSMICREFGATLIINDHVKIAGEVDAAGVHIGKEDMHPQEARDYIGKERIIGGSSNTINDILRIEKHVDYIGLGPFRFTQTKAKLSPVLGVEGYAVLVKEIRSRGIQLPIIAIGGIEVNDVPGILETGIYGVAISSSISGAADPKKKTEEFIEIINSFQS